VTSAMVHEAANEVQLGERQVKRVRWPLLLGATAVVAVAVLAVASFSGFQLPSDSDGKESESAVMQVADEPETEVASLPQPVPESLPEPIQPAMVEALDKDWLEGHQQVVWQGLAEIWRQPGAGFAIQAACNEDDSLGYACLRDQGNWLKINRLGLPVILVLQNGSASYLLLQGVDDDRLLVGAPGQLTTVSRESVESSWLGSYLVVWPQAAGWPSFVGRGDTGPAVATIMEMASLVDVPYHGNRVFDAAFELWLKDFQARNGLEADGIVGRNTLLHLMTASIQEPKLLRTWE